MEQEVSKERYAEMQSRSSVLNTWERHDGSADDMIGGRDEGFGREITTARRFSRHPFRTLLQSIRIRAANDLLPLVKSRFQVEESRSRGSSLPFHLLDLDLQLPVTVPVAPPIYLPLHPQDRVLAPDDPLPGMDAS